MLAAFLGVCQMIRGRSSVAVITALDQEAEFAWTIQCAPMAQPHWASDGAAVLLRPGNAGEGEGPRLLVCF